MWISFPLGRSRVGIPWWIAVPLLPLILGVWVLTLTVAAIRWVWRPRPRHHSAADDGVSIRVTTRRNPPPPQGEAGG